MKERVFVSAIGFLVGTILFEVVPIPENLRLITLLVGLIVLLIISYFNKRILRFFTIFLIGVLIGTVTILMVPGLRGKAIIVSNILVIVMAIIVTIILGLKESQENEEEQ